jgi:Circularly permutated YpsA SLOG family
MSRAVNPREEPATSMDQMTLDELKTLETARYGRYVDQYDHAGMDAALRADLDEVRDREEAWTPANLCACRPRQFSGLNARTLDNPCPVRKSLLMFILVISGRQTGADQAGWRAAQACDIPTGGWMPLHFMTENGAESSLGRLYDAKTLPTESYCARINRSPWSQCATQTAEKTKSVSTKWDMNGNRAILGAVRALSTGATQ